MKPSPKKLKETKNIYHKVVDHLISEGYATDSDSADNIIKGMSDEWFETIIEEDYSDTVDGVKPQPFIYPKGFDPKNSKGIPPSAEPKPPKYPKGVDPNKSKGIPPSATPLSSK